MTFKPKRVSRLRRFVARFYYHNGNRDAHNNPTLSVDADWIKRPVVFFCEMQETAGGEKVRGRQVTASTTHVLFGERRGLLSVKPTDRCVVGGQNYEVVATHDPDGKGIEGRIEIKAESDGQ